ncbi:MAG: TIGR01777 family protein [Flavobacteriaceae bacterium]|nr:TIGR01777 family oxidoreductase [Bacteroidia bacterium]NNL16199.1 TIGR01777 family protein [Flavobacteriaceae bacterium]
MKVLITGATGLIGSKITKLCLEKGWSVNYLTTNRSKIVNERNYNGFYWNPKSNEIDVKCFQGVDAIFHLVGASVAQRWTDSYKKEILFSRIQTTKLLHQSIKNGKYAVKKIVSASAVGIYPSSLTNYYDEKNKDINPGFLGEVVHKWESEVDSFKSLNIDVVKLRIGIVLSNNGGALPKMSQPVKYGVGSAFGSGEQWQSWIHINDLVAMFLYVLENNISGIYNAVAPNPVTNEELIKAIAKQVKRPLILPNIPKAIMQLALGEMHIILFDSQRVCSKKIEKLGFEFSYNNLRPALEDLL